MINSHVPETPPYQSKIFIFAGGLFDDSEEITIENAFRYAISRVNRDKTLLTNTNIVYDIQHLPSQNSFLASKKGKSIVVLNFMLKNTSYSHNIKKKNNVKKTHYLKHFKIYFDLLFIKPKLYLIESDINVRYHIKAF